MTIAAETANTKGSASPAMTSRPVGLSLAIGLRRELQIEQVTVSKARTEASRVKSIVLPARSGRDRGLACSKAHSLKVRASSAASSVAICSEVAAELSSGRARKAAMKAARYLEDRRVKPGPRLKPFFRRWTCTCSPSASRDFCRRV